MPLIKTLVKLSKTTEKIVANLATGACLVLREETTPGKGYTLKSYEPTTVEALPVLYSEIVPAGAELAEVTAAQRRPVIFRRLTFQSTADVRATDRLRLFAPGAAQPVEMDVVKVYPALGLVRIVIAVEEVAQS